MSNSEIRIRVGRESDFEAVCEIFRKRAGKPPDQPQTIANGLKPGSGTDYIVAEVDGETVAYGCRYRNTISFLCRLKDDRVKGIGDSLLAHLEQHIQNDGHTKIELYAYPVDPNDSLEKIVRFYERNGYRVTFCREGFSIDGARRKIGAEMMKNIRQGDAHRSSIVY